MRTLASALFLFASVSFAQITVDGNASEWTGTAPATVNSAAYTYQTAGKTTTLNEWIWKDEVLDQRTDLGSTINDLLEVRVASDGTNLYYLAKISPNQTSINQIQITLRRAGSSSTQTYLVGNADTKVPSGAAWDYLIVSRGGSSNSNNIVWTPEFSMSTVGSYAQIRTTGILEGSVPWSSLGGTPGGTSMLFTFSLYVADGSDNTVDIGGSSISNCLDCVTTTGGNTWTVVSSGSLDYAPSVTFLSDNNVLPVQLASFSAATVGNGSTRLAWTTLSEVNNFGFFVERCASREGVYSALPDNFVAGHGTTLERHEYAYTDNTTMPGRWFYRLKQVDLDGTAHYLEPLAVEVLTTLENAAAPMEFSLAQNYPNPFNPSTTIEFALPRELTVHLELYDALGQRVAELLSGRLAAGRHQVVVDASPLASGVYFYRLRAGAMMASKRLVVAK